MGKIVNEMIENFPELEKDKDVLDKTANFLNENKPQIDIDKNFKSNLKNRLNGLIFIKTGKKNKFSTFLIPVFSFMFVIGGFFYYFKDINFLINDDKPIGKEISESDIKIREVDEVGKILEEELNLILETEKISEESLKNQDKGEIKYLKTIIEDQIIEEDIINDESSEILNDVSSFKSFNMEIGNSDLNIDLNDENVEDNELIQMFGLSDEDIQEFGAENLSGFGISSSMMIDSYEDEGGLQKTINEENFSNYCDDMDGELTGTGELEKCILNEKECFSSEFKNGTCEFK